MSGTPGPCHDYGEAFRLAHVLSRDPSSAVAASVQGWQYPLSRDAMTLADLFDLQHQSKSKRKPKAYPRPWADSGRRVIGRTKLSRDQLDTILHTHRKG